MPRAEAAHPEACPEAHPEPHPEAHQETGGKAGVQLRGHGQAGEPEIHVRMEMSVQVARAVGISSYNCDCGFLGALEGRLEKCIDLEID